MTIESMTIIGASRNSDKWGHKALRKALEDGVEVYAVNPNVKDIIVEINGDKRIVETYAKLLHVPKRTSHVVIYRPRNEIHGGLIEAIIEKHIPTVIFPMEEGVERDETWEEDMTKYLKRRGYSDSQIMMGVCPVRDKI